MLDFRSGVKEGAPLAVSIFAYGLVFGVLARQAGLTYWETVLMSGAVGNILGDAHRYGLDFAFLGIGILTAFVVPGLLLSKGEVNFSWQNHYLLAGVLSGLVAARWKSIFLAMGSGMLLIVVLRLIFT